MMDSEIGLTPRTALEERQHTLSHLVRLVANGFSTGLFVAGTGGSGKSRTISRVLAHEGIEPVLVNSHITPLSLFEVLYKHRHNKVIWLDDCDSIYTNMPILGLLRSCLWGQGERIVTYRSTVVKEIPQSFNFDSKLIMCSNVLPKNEAFQAVLSRVDVFDLSLSTSECIEQMKVIALKGFRSLSAEQCISVVEFIEESVGDRQLSMRIYEPSLRKVEYAIANSIDWQDLVLSQLNQIGKGVLESSAKQSPRELDLAIMRTAIEAHPENVRLQQDLWCDHRGKSRASFFRAKKMYEATAEGDK